MKRTPLKRIGKQGRRNLKANRILNEKLGHINYCEARLEGCLGSMFLQKAHRHKRSWYYKQPELLSDVKQVVIMCQNCHDKTEHNRELNREVFERLRGEEESGGSGGA